MKKKNIEEQIAEDICELNCHQIPKRLKRKILINSPYELGLALNILEAYVPYEKWLKTWTKQDLGKK